MNIWEALVVMTGIGTAGGVAYAWIENWRQVRLGPSKDPEELLRQMLVRGEITEDQYEKRLALLRYGPKLELN